MLDWLSIFPCNDSDDEECKNKGHAAAPYSNADSMRNSVGTMVSGISIGMMVFQHERHLHMFDYEHAGPTSRADENNIKVYHFVPW